MQVRSTLATVDTPLGESFVPDMAPIARARQQDLNKTMTYPVTFSRNAEGRVVLDRRRNTADLVAQYYNMAPEKIVGRVAWDMENPNDLSLRLPRGGDVETRVTRRLQVRFAGSQHSGESAARPREASVLDMLSVNFVGGLHMTARHVALTHMHGQVQIARDVISACKPAVRVGPVVADMFAYGIHTILAHSRNNFTVQRNAK